MKLVYKFLLPTIFILLSGFYFILNKNVSSQNTVVNFLQDNSKELLIDQLKQREKSELAIENSFLNFSANTISNLSANFVINFDNDGLYRELQYYFNIEAIKAISVYDDMSKSFFMIIYKNNNGFQLAKTLPKEIKSLKYITKNMIFEGEKIGSITIYYDEYKILNKINKTKQGVMDKLKKFTVTLKEQRESYKQEQLTTALIVLIILIISIVTLSYQIVLNPLKKLQLGLNNFFLFLQNKKDSADNIQLNTNDEFEQMAKSLNENITVSAKLHEEIYELNENLEDKVKEKTQKVTTLLDNAGQGFLTFNKEFIIDDEYSNECEKLFGKKIAQENIINILFKDKNKRNFFEDVVISAIEETAPAVKKSYISLLPSEIILNKRALKLEYKILKDKKVMLIITNITAQKKLERKVKQEQNILKMIVSVVSDSDTFYDTKRDYINFIKSYKRLIDTTKTPLYNINKMYRIIHTFKGTFLQLHMQNCVDFLHTLETDISNMLKENTSSSKDLIYLFDNTDFRTSLQTDINAIGDILGKEFLNNENFIQVNIDTIKNLQLAVLNTFKQKAPITQEDQEILNYVQNLSNQKLSSLLKPYINLTQQLATRLEKEIYEFEIIGDNDIFVTDKYKPFIKSLIHIFRNGIDHGIETLDERLEKNKDEIGTIACSFNIKDDNLEIIISDDGAGINKEKVIEKAIEQNIISTEDSLKLNDNDIYQLVFNDNFSTKEDVSDISGRGIGMSAVKSE